jgi:hypothetical protein
MKKFLFIVPVLVLLAAGCNSTQQATVQTPSANQATQTNPDGGNLDNTSTQNTGSAVYVNSAFGYQFNYPSNLVSISAANKAVTKPLTDSNVVKLNNLVVGGADGHAIFQVNVIRNQDEAGALFQIEKLNDTKLWTAPTKVTINGTSFSKYVLKKASPEFDAEAYYGTDGKNYFYLGLKDKTEGGKILSTFKFVSAKAAADANAFVKTKEDSTTIYYSGQATVSGSFNESNDGLVPNLLCFTANSGAQLPVSSQDKGFFCFDNQLQAKALLGIDDAKVFSPTCADIKGSATIIITSYKVSKHTNSEEVDLAVLSKVVSSDKPKCQ